MNQTRKIIQFPTSVSIGELFLVDANRLPEKYQSANKLAISSTTAGPARGKRTINVNHDQKLLLELNPDNLSEEMLHQCSSLNEIDIVSGITTDDQLSAVVNCMPAVRGLIFPEHHEGISTTAYSGISKLTQLEYLNMIASYCAGGAFYMECHMPQGCLAGLSKLKFVAFPAEEFVDQIAGLPNIETLIVMKATPGSKVNRIRSLTRNMSKTETLKHLSLHEPELAVHDLENIALLESLESLSIYLANYYHSINRFPGIEKLANLTKLRSLRLHSLREWPLEILKDMHHLEELSLEFCPSANESAWIARLPNLKRLLIASPGYKRDGVVTNELIDNILKLPNLVSLGLRDCKGLTPAHVAQLSGLSQLTELDLCDSFISDPVVEAIADSLPKLRKLNLSCQYNFSQIATNPIGRLTELRWLNVSLRIRNNADLEPLAKLTKLEWLDIHQHESDVSNYGIASLLPLKNLRYLHMDGCRGVNDNVIPILLQFPNLLCLGDVLMTGISKEIRDSAAIVKFTSY